MIVISQGTAIAFCAVVLAVTTAAIVFLLWSIFKDVRDFWKYCPMKPMVIPTIVLLIPTAYAGMIMVFVEVIRGVVMP